MRSARPSRISPAAASTMASYWPSSSLRSRVSRLPRSGSMCRSGRCGQQLHHAAQARRADARTLRQRPRATRSGSTRRRRAGLRARAPRPARSPSGSSIGTSLSECTARCARPSASAGLEFLDEQALAADLGQRDGRGSGRRAWSCPAARRAGRSADAAGRARVRPATGRGGSRGSRWR